MWSRYWDRTFPHRDRTAYRHTSRATRTYNCIAWAAGDDSAWWEHTDGYRWPNAPRTPDVASLVAVFTGLGFQRCFSGDLEAGVEKVAIYCDADGMWTHAARQLETGAWTSKIGRLRDVHHATPACLQGDLYGQVHCFMQRPRIA